jgi:TetR/AcrR family transcriptional regulator, repressor for uid operon
LPKLKPEELETRRQEIIEAARTCFLRNGFHRTTTDEICKQASITPGGLYHYFGGKDEIIAAVIQQQAEGAIGRVRALVEGDGGMRGNMGELAQQFIGTMNDPNIDDVVRLEIEIWAESFKNPKLGDLSKEAWALRQDWMETMVRKGAEEGLYNTKDVDARGLASLLTAILLGMRLGKVLWKDEFDLNGAIAAMFMVHSGRVVMEMPGINGILTPKVPEKERAARAS